MTLDKNTYSRELLETTGVLDTKGASIPLEPIIRYKQTTEHNTLNAEGGLKYRQTIGGLLYLVGRTVPDLPFATTYMSQFNSCSSKEQTLGWCATYIALPAADQKNKSIL